MASQVFQQSAKQLFSLPGVFALLLFQGGMEQSGLAAGREPMHFNNLIMLAAAFK